MHPVANVAGPKTKFLRYHPEPGVLSMNRGRGGVLHSSWNWELISDKPLDWWLPRIERIKKAFPAPRPDRVHHGGLGQRQGARTLAHARDTPARTPAPTASS